MLDWSEAGRGRDLAPGGGSPDDNGLRRCHGAAAARRGGGAVVIAPAARAAGRMEPAAPVSGARGPGRGRGPAVRRGAAGQWWAMQPRALVPRGGLVTRAP